ncbi:MAG: phosphoribosyltransferase [Microgenomates group bacterium]
MRSWRRGWERRKNISKIKNQISKIKIEIERREKEFRGDKPPLKLKDKIVILTDDGVATGATMTVAVEIVRQQEPKKLIVAVPVIARDTLEKISALADEVIYLDAPALFFAVGQFYREFEQISDEEVVEILNVKCKN